MSRKSKSPRIKTQELKARLKEQRQQQKYHGQLQRAQKRERDAILRHTISLGKKTGLYNPKSLKLTKYRRYRARQLARKYSDYLNEDKFFFVKAPPKARKQILEKATELNMETTRKGIFIAKEGHTKASIKRDKKHKEYYIVRSGKTKRGPTRGARYKTITPLASADELDHERDRLRRLAKSFGPLKENERITFKVIENGIEGYGQTTFSNIEGLLRYLDSYNKTIPAKVNFFRHITLDKVSSPKEYFKYHPSTTTGRAGRKKRDEIRAENKARSMSVRKGRAKK